VKSLFFLFCLFLNLMPTLAFAGGSSLVQIKPDNLGMKAPDGYDIIVDQMFRIDGKGFEGKKIFFADSPLGGNAIPKVFVALDGKILEPRLLKFDY